MNILYYFSFAFPALLIWWKDHILWLAFRTPPLPWRKNVLQSSKTQQNQKNTLQANRLLSLQTKKCHNQRQRKGNMCFWRTSCDAGACDICRRESSFGYLDSLSYRPLLLHPLLHWYALCTSKRGASFLCPGATFNTISDGQLKNSRAAWQLISGIFNTIADAHKASDGESEWCERDYNWLTVHLGQKTYAFLIWSPCGEFDLNLYILLNFLKDMWGVVAEVLQDSCITWAWWAAQGVCYDDINERIKQARTLITGRRIDCEAASVISYF